MDDDLTVIGDIDIVISTPETRIRILKGTRRSDHGPESQLNFNLRLVLLSVM